MNFKIADRQCHFKHVDSLLPDPVQLVSKTDTSFHYLQK
jgi:hypothetical protein